MKGMRTAAMAGLLVIPALLFAQYLPCWDYGTAEDERAMALVEQNDEDRGYVLAGWTTGFPQMVPIDHDLLIMATDSRGTPTWAWSNLPNTNEMYDLADEAWSMCRTADGGYAITGWTQSLGVHAQPPNPPGSYDIFIIRLNPDGTVQWANTYTNMPNPVDERAFSIIENSNGNLVVIGYDVWSGTRWILVMEVAPNGAFVQARRLWPAVFDQAEGLAITEVPGNPTIRYAVVGRCDVGGSGTYDAFMAYLDANLQMAPGWPLFYIPGTADEEAYSVVFDTNTGDVVVAGWTNSYDFAGGVGEPNIFVAKFDTVLGSGPLWSSIYGWQNGGEFLYDDRSLTVDASGSGYELCGYTYSVGPTPLTPPNYLVMKLDNAGNVLWARAHPSDAEEDAQEFAYPMIQNLAGEFAIAGWRDAGALGNQDIHLLVVDGNGDRPRCVVEVDPERMDIPVLPELFLEPEDARLHPYQFDLREVDPGGEEVCVYTTSKDAGCIKIDAPSGSYNLNDVETPACSVYNFGGTTETYNVRMKIGTFYNQTATVTSHAPGDTEYVTFPNVTLSTSGNFMVTCSTELTGDADDTNDKCSGMISVLRPGTKDVGCSLIVAPVGGINQGTTVTPACSVYNYGNTTESYTARFRIGSFYDQTASVTSHAPGTMVYVTFPNWTASQPKGSYTTMARTELSGDVDPTNNTRYGTVTIRFDEDVGTSYILAPTGDLSPGTAVTPACSVYNFGANNQSGYTVRMKIGSAYNQTATVAGPHAPNTNVYVAFPSWTTTAGSHVVSCSTELATDEQTSNDKLTDLARVRTVSSMTPGWFEHTLAPVPAGRSGRPVKRGGWLAYCTSNGLIYAAKGYKTNEFYSFDPATGAWTALCSIPEGPEGKLPEKGSKGVSDGSRYIYMTKGNNTLGFWRYDKAANTWDALPDVPLGPFRKKVKGGTDMVYVPAAMDGDTDYVYLMKGYKTEFYRYSVQGASWDTLPDMPSGPRGKWKRGSWLLGWPSQGQDIVIIDGIVAHHANYYDRATNHHHMYMFDVFRETWSTEMKGMPLYGLHRGKVRKKKSKDGASAALGNDGAGYVVKGGNSQQFASFIIIIDGDAPDSVVWTELDTIPFYGSTGRKKGVKYGGDIVHAGADGFFDVFYVLKGNKTKEFWRYAHTGPHALGREGLMAGPTAASRPDLTVATSPFARGFTTVSYTVSKPGPASLLVLDAAGRCVSRRDLMLERQGRVTQDVRDLAAGVYLLRLDTGEGSASAKLVVQK